MAILGQKVTDHFRMTPKLKLLGIWILPIIGLKEKKLHLEKYIIIYLN